MKAMGLETGRQLEQEQVIPAEVDMVSIIMLSTLASLPSQNSRIVC